MPTSPPRAPGPTSALVVAWLYSLGDVAVLLATVVIGWRAVRRNSAVARGDDQTVDPRLRALYL